MKHLRKIAYLGVVATVLLGGCASLDDAAVVTPKPEPRAVQGWMTTGDQASKMAPQSAVAFADGVQANADETIITVNPNEQHQQIEGFGASFTDATSWLMNKRMTAAQRHALIKELFDPKEGLGFALTRLTVGASDFSREHYSYADMPKGQADPDLTSFSIAKAKEDVLPVTREAMVVNPDLKIMVTPWSPPGWMKTTDSLIKGRLKPEYYGAFARYLRKTVDAFTDAGVPVYALTIQNEPHFEPENYPGMRVEPAERAKILADHVGPLFPKGEGKTKLLDWDHNWDQPESPLAVLADPKAKAALSGVAWHCYAGDVTAQEQISVTHPDMEQWFTECTGGAWAPKWGDTLVWNVSKLIIGTSRTGSKGTILWNLALDEKSGPHLGGCGDCRGVVTIDNASGAVTRNVEYYSLGHASRFTKPGAVRVGSTSGVDGVESVAFENPDKSIALIMVNGGADPRRIRVVFNNQSFVATVPAQAVVTWKW